MEERLIERDVGFEELLAICERSKRMEEALQAIEDAKMAPSFAAQGGTPKEATEYAKQWAAYALAFDPLS